jgi:hypothetical protein
MGIHLHLISFVFFSPFLLLLPLASRPVDHGDSGGF